MKHSESKLSPSQMYLLVAAAMGDALAWGNGVSIPHAPADAPRVTSATVASIPRLIVRHGEEFYPTNEGCVALERRNHPSAAHARRRWRVWQTAVRDEKQQELSEALATAEAAYKHAQAEMDKYNSEYAEWRKRWGSDD